MQTGCRRVPLSDDFYPALQRPNVRLVSAAVAALSDIEVIDSDGRRHAVDAVVFAVVFATGFDATEAPALTHVQGG